MGAMTPDEMNILIQGVQVIPLKQIVDERGAVLHMLRCDAPMFKCFGEVYFSEVKPGVVKAWKRHSRMTQYFAVPTGRIKFVIYDDRTGSATVGRVAVFELGRPDAYYLLVIPPRLWYGFQGLADSPSLIANCSDIPHDPAESESSSKDSDFIHYEW